MKQVDTIVLVSDIKRSHAFYNGILGLEIVHDWESMMVYKNRLAIHQADLLQPQEVMNRLLKKGKQGGNNLIIYLELENESIESCFERLSGENVELIHGIYALPWQKIFRLYDPDGHIVEVGEAP